MKIRTENDLLERLDEEFAWRRKELTSIWTDVQSGPVKLRPARLRAGVALLYAHWEGFVKTSADLFLQFVALRRLRHDELSPGLLSLALRRRLREFAETNSVTGHIDFVSFLQADLGSRARLPTRSAVKTGANLNSDRFKTIVLTLGFDYSLYELKENLIDKQLLQWRNTIAHGKEFCPAPDDFNRLYSEVTELLRLFKNQLENAVLLKTYRRGE